MRREKQEIAWHDEFLHSQDFSKLNVIERDLMEMRKSLDNPSQRYRFNSVSSSGLAHLKELIAHEFTHGYFSQGHCKADDPHCIMQDAKKKPNFAIKDSLCSVCREEIELNL